MDRLNLSIKTYLMAEALGRNLTDVTTVLAKKGVIKKGSEHLWEFAKELIEQVCKTER
jgi:hypothetical protein